MLTLAANRCKRLALTGNAVFTLLDGLSHFALFLRWRNHHPQPGPEQGGR